MPDLFAFLLKVNIALILFCAGYYLVLRKLTFYTLNRVYLVSAIILSSVYPFIDLSGFAQKHQQIVEPVQNVVIVWKAPAENFVKQAAYWNWLEALFWTVAIILAMRLMSQLFSLYAIYRRSDEREINGQKVRVVSGDISPFSFWQSIFVNPDKLSPDDLQNVIEHEQVHVKEWHTLDILLSEISVIFYWFNPGVWMMKRAVRENIEFITDRKIIQRGVDSRAYQYSLLNVSFNQHAPAALTSNFNFSTLKKRIKMMNAQRSSKLNLTRYAVLVPMVTVCLLAFSLSKAEVVKNNAVVKTIKAATVTTLDKLSDAITLPADTTPKPKKITRTFTVVTDDDGKGNRTVNITTEGNARTYNIVTDTGKNTLISGRGVSTILSGLNRFNSVNIDSIKTIMINGKKATPEEAAKLLKDLPQPGVQSLTGIVVNGKPLNTTTYTFDGSRNFSMNGNDIVIARRQNFLAGTYKTIDSAVKVNGFWVARDKDSLERTTNLKRLGNLSNANDEIIVKGYGTRLSSAFGAEASSAGSPTNFKGKLIVIDGKVATETELKKVSVMDIEETISLPAKTAVKYYGEKAKNGAVVITTIKKK
ncbi:M56 family metallopeptidase [Mucilaginibacter auburnensis]|uniref:Beta-lactamase regulating signal transducer with metallopeptidase domain n=1 Tax=Mucilaginibacter auburnensis TaxID=1457233 RepID=A0A2H9VNJ3_9SPHI|nr:M56 family metallopeptidase [Mucilaginibacter auburnensis]PJJ79907.1 beta-lactamase regulating signal transducer with metallopeptidase domain [Mucilaginibacter auburnensis]